MNEVLAYRNVVETGDLLFVTRYNLPESDSDGVSDAWCAYLINQTGCDETPADPEEATSLTSSRAFTALYTDYTGTDFSGTLQSQTNVPRIGHGLHSAYLAPGHGLTWADGNTVVCIEANTAFFTTAAEQDCAAPAWSTATSDTASQRAALEDDLQQLVSNLEAELALPANILVNGDGVTVSGRVYALEILSIMDRLVPEAFVASVRSVIDAGYTPSASESQLQQSLDTDATDFISSLNWIGLNVFDLSGGLIATIAMLAAGIGIGFLCQWVTGHSDMFYFGFMTAPVVGLAFRAPTIAVVFVAIVVIGTLAGWWLLRKAPSS